VFVGLLLLCRGVWCVDACVDNPLPVANQLFLIPAPNLHLLMVDPKPSASLRLVATLSVASLHSMRLNGAAGAALSLQLPTQPLVGSAADAVHAAVWLTHLPTRQMPIGLRGFRVEEGVLKTVSRDRGLCSAAP
jgi:hypothetical protein